jgi:hypothetical protein
MISMDIRLRDRLRGVDFRSLPAIFGSSRIDAFASPILSHQSFVRQNSLHFWVGEENDPYQADTRAALSELDAYSGHIRAEGIVVRCSGLDGIDEVQVARTYRGTTPIYVASCGDRLILSWRFEDALACLAHIVPNVDACRIFLDHGSARSRDQIISGTYMLWPGEALTFGRNGLVFKEAPSRAIPASTPLVEDARVCDAFFQIIKDELSRFAGLASAPLVELSGGLDSSTLALAAGAVFDRAFSYGLLQIGVVGRQQKARRREIVGLSGLIDFEGRADAIPPFRGLTHEENCLTVMDDNHRPACVYAVDQHPHGPFDLVIAGIGGDELMMEHTYTHEAWEVPGTVCRSSVVSGVARADMFMRRGIWPINPFASIELVDFCRALPESLRRHRHLVRFNLARQGVSDGFLFPRFDEHYGELMRYEMAFIDFDDLLTDSIVGSLGLINLGNTLKEAREGHYSGYSYEEIGRLWHIVKLEKVLQRHMIQNVTGVGSEDAFCDAFDVLE